MLRQWNRWRIAILAGMLLLNSPYVMAAPLELSLSDSIALALKNSPEIKIAEEDKVNADWGVAEVKGKFGPSVTFTHTDTRTGIPSFTLGQYLAGTPFAGMADTAFGGVYNSFGNTLSVGIPLYTGGNLEGLLDQAKRKRQIAELELRKTRQQLKQEATIAYFDVLAAQDQVAVNQEALNNLVAHLNSVQVQYTEGVVNKSDALRSEVEVINARQDLLKAKNNYDIAIVSLKNVLGLPLTEQVKVKAELSYQKYTRSLAECLQYAGQYRPDIRRSDAKSDMMQSGIKVAKSSNLPQISFKGSNNWNDDKFPGTNQDYWLVSLTASINLFDSGVGKAKVKEAESLYGKAREEARKTREAVQLEINQAYMNLQLALARIETGKNAVAKAQEAYRINEIRYQEGEVANLDVIDAQLALIKAKTNYNQALYDYNSSKAKLDKAMGLD